MKTIFLDIDGVLHPFDTAIMLPSEACPGISGENLFCWAPLLAEILSGSDQPGAPAVQIVIHSTWRHNYSLEAIRNMFPQTVRPRVKGCTEGIGRLEGIRQYVEEQAITDYLVIDDIADFFPDDWPHLLACAGETGISDPRVQARLREFLAG